MKFFYLVMSWIFGIFSLMAGFSCLTGIDKSPLSGLAMLLISLLLLPPVRNFAYSKTNKELPAMGRGVAIFVLIIAFGVFNEQSQDRKVQEIAAQKAQAREQKVQEGVQKAAALRQQNINYFNGNSSRILNEVKTAFKSGNYKKVVFLSSTYLETQNQELIDLNAKASTELALIEKLEKETKENAEREAKTQEILTQLESVPASEYQRNRDLYQKLVTYNPNIEQYKEELNLYSDKIKKRSRDGNKIIESCADAMTIEKNRCQQVSVGEEFTFNGKVKDVLTPYKAHVMLHTERGNFADVFFHTAEAENLKKDENIKFTGILKSVGTGIFINHEIEGAVMVRE